MNVSILTSAHKYNDDRLYHHFSKSLSNKGHYVHIVSSDCDMKTTGKISIDSFNGLHFTRKEKVELYIKKLTSFNPAVIICLEPITILAAHKYSKNKRVKIIYDITEWYPSKSLLKNHVIVLRPLYFLFYTFLFLSACLLSDGFINGEFYKGIIPKRLFPKKKNIQISYFPKKKYFKITKPHIEKNNLKLCYTGLLSFEKGLINFLAVLEELITSNNLLQIDVKLIGAFHPEEKGTILKHIHKLNKNIHIRFFDFQELTKYIQLISDVDIFLDLRKLDFVNSHSLPIKLFYFIALQRPIIYSNLKAIKKEVETKDFGYLVDPKNAKIIAEIIINYQKNRTLYLSHCSNARELFESKYNWEIQENNFIHFVEDFESKEEFSNSK